jgi:hypothetical protein
VAFAADEIYITVNFGVPARPAETGNVLFLDLPLSAGSRAILVLGGFTHEHVPVQ